MVNSFSGVDVDLAELVAHRIEVELGSLSIGDRFACHFPDSALAAGVPDRVVSGTVLWPGVGSVEIIRDGATRGETERWATGAAIYKIEENERITNIMAQAKATPAAVAPATNQTAGLKGAFLSRIAFQQKKADEASAGGDTEKMTMHLTKIEEIKAEAEAKGVDLTTAKASTGGNAAGPAAVAAPTPVTKAQKGEDAVAKRNAALAAHKATTAAAPRAKKEKVLRPCLDGCGAMVKGSFTIGHDAKLKSLIGKIERGEEVRDAIPEVAQGLVKFVKGEMIEEKNKDGKTISKTQLLVCTAAPVKIPGREGFTVTAREAE